jgi:hypothetical protein
MTVELGFAKLYTSEEIAEQPRRCLRGLWELPEHSLTSCTLIYRLFEPVQLPQRVFCFDARSALTEVAR